MYLINTFQSSAQIALGEMENPMTRKVETNLDQAGYYIDLLEIVKKKTNQKRLLKLNQCKKIFHFQRINIL